MCRGLVILLPIAMIALTGCAADSWGRKGFVSTPTGKLYYEEMLLRPGDLDAVRHGRPIGPHVVLIHGGQMNCRMWDDQFSRLGKDHHVVRYDIRGYGKSPPPDKPYFHHDELRALLDHLHIERATLVGLSLGGSIAIDFALTYPDRVDKLVAVAPGLSGFQWSSDSYPGYRRIIAAVQAGDPDRAADLWLAEPMMAGANEQPALRARVRELLLRSRACWLNNPMLERDLDPPAVRRLAEIRVPTLAIVGDRDVADIQRIVQQIETQVPGARRVVIAGASHIVNMERPEEFNRVLADFLLGP